MSHHSRVSRRLYVLLHESAVIRPNVSVSVRRFLSCSKGATRGIAGREGRNTNEYPLFCVITMISTGIR